MKFFIAMRRVRLDSVLAGDKKDISVTDRTISRDRLHAHHGNSKVAKHFTMYGVWFQARRRQMLINEYFSVRSRQWLVGTGLLLSIVQQSMERRYFSAGRFLALVFNRVTILDEVVELVVALDEVEVPVHEEFIWLHFVDNLPPRYEYVKRTTSKSRRRH